VPALTVATSPRRTSLPFAPATVMASNAEASSPHWSERGRSLTRPIAAV
jgi:hypothetical protein